MAGKGFVQHQVKNIEKIHKDSQKNCENTGCTHRKVKMDKEKEEGKEQKVQRTDVNVDIIDSGQDDGRCSPVVVIEGGLNIFAHGQGEMSDFVMSTTCKTGLDKDDELVFDYVTFAGREQNMYASFTSEPDDVMDLSPTTPTKADGLVKNRPQSLLTHRKDRGESTYEGKYLSVSPANQLDFEVTDLKKESLDILTLTNNHQENRVAFKVKTTSPEKYRVRPSTGVVRSGSSTEVSVYLQPGITNVARDKFLVMAMDIGTDGFSSSGELAEKWRSEPRDNIMEHRLRTNVIEKLKSPVEEGVPESSLSPVTKNHDSPLLEKKIDDMNRKLENILRLYRSQEQRLDRIYRYQVFFCLCLVFIGVAVALSYKLDYLPIQKYTVNACMPHFMH